MTTETKNHTPGPWRPTGGKAGEGTLIVAGPPVTYICRLDSGCSGHHPSNARLIASAPTLLSLVERIVNQAVLVPCKEGGEDAAEGEPGAMAAGKWRVESSLDGWIAEAREAIAKAKGES